jgi:hypothetical protein
MQYANWLLLLANSLQYHYNPVERHQVGENWQAVALKILP